MITKTIDKHAVSIIPEEPDDIMVLRRIISPGNFVTGSTTRTIKREKESIRPDRGERVRIRMRLEAQKILLDGALDRLLVRGVVLESDNESISHGTHHTLQIRVGDAITVAKNATWKNIELSLLKRSSGETGFVIIAIDTSECGIARIKGTHVKIIPNVYSGASGKRYKTSNIDMDKFYNSILTTISSIIQKDDNIIAFGPGQTKNRLANYLQKKGTVCKVIEGVDTGGEDGIHIFTKSKAMAEIMSESKMVRALHIVDQVMMLAGRKSTKFAMGFNEVKHANELGAVDSLVFSDEIIRGSDEDEIIQFLNDIESKGAEAIAVDASTDVGLRVTGLGGMVALLRFAIVS